MWWLLQTSDADFFFFICAYTYFMIVLQKWAQLYILYVIIFYLYKFLKLIIFFKYYINALILMCHDWINH